MTENSDNIPKKSRLTIGLLKRGFADEFSAPFWNGIADVAKEQDVNLISFSGGMLHSPIGFEAQGNVLYDLIDAQNGIDGLVIWTGIIGHYVSVDELRVFCECFHNLPIVSVEVPLEGIPSVLGDFYQGMRDVIKHLIKVHGYRRIAFIRGAEDSVTGEERYRAYIELLSEYGIPIEQDLIAPGTFFAPSGAEAIELLLDKRKVKFEAIVAANDNMALDAIQAIQAHGLRVPEDIAVVGFDNIEESRFTIPPLTTVRLPMYEWGRRGAEILLAQLRGEKVLDQEYLPMEVMVRQSCGCVDSSILQANITQIMEKTINTTDFSVNELSDFYISIGQVEQFSQDTNRSILTELSEQLLNAFKNELSEKETGNFILELRRILSYVVKIDGDISSWQNILSIIRRYCLCSVENTEDLFRGENLLHQARVMVSDFAQRVQAYRRLQAEKQNHKLHEIAQNIATSFDLNSLMDVLAGELQQIGINRGYLSFYNNFKTPSEFSRLILAYDEIGRIDLEPNGQYFPSRQLLPPNVLRGEKRYNLVVEPLYFRDEQLGFAVFEVTGLLENRICETIRGQLSSALKGVLLFHERELAEEALARQTIELARSNDELQQFAYVASHDLQEPLRKILTFGDRLREKSGENLNEQCRDYLIRMQNAAKRMQDLIEALLTYSRITTKTQPFTAVDLKKVAHEVLLDMEIRIEEDNGQIDIGELGVIEAEPMQMRQLFQNFIGNALKFHKPQENPHIEINSRVSKGKIKDYEGNICEITFKDNGIGIDEKYYERIFGVFQRLHGRDEYKGTGIGLAICKKIVERHSGEIVVESKLGEGSQFIVRLPVKQNINIKSNKGV